MRKNDVVFWTRIEGLPEIEPIKPAHNFIPGWFYNVPSWVENQIPNIDKSTVRRCPGIIDFFKLGYVVPLWCDLYININEDGSYIWRTPDERFKFVDHPRTQFTDYIPDEAQKNVSLVLKAYCPWYAKTPKGVSLLQIPMSYNFDQRFSLLPGTIQTDKYHYLNQQLIIHSKGETFIPKGTPLGTYIPISREKYNLIVRHETPEDYKLLEKVRTSIQSKFSGAYRKIISSTND